mgnify:CR=1 FL=1
MQMVLIGCVYVRSAAISCIKKRFRIEILLRFYSICLLFAGIYGILKKRIRRVSVRLGQRAVYAARRACRQKGSSNSVHDFRKGIQVQTKAQPVKTGVAKPDGPKRSFFSAWQPVAKGTLLPPCRVMRAVKGVFYLETEQPFCVANSHFKKNQPSVLLGKE